MDSSESELGILDLIQVFVETLDKCFENVCELDLIFHVDKVIYSNFGYLQIFCGIHSFYFATGTLHIERTGYGWNGVRNKYE